MISIENKHLRIGINQKGAELSTIFSFQNKIEYLWQADPAYWSRHSCILFPNIGSVREGVIRIEDQEYHIPKHGLVRDRSFAILKKSEDAVTLVTQSDQNTVKSYPFDFRLAARYQLEDHTCKITYEVSTDGPLPVPFNIGAHPAFNCPIHQDEKRSDYHLLFEKEENQISPIINRDGLITTQYQEVVQQSRKLLLKDDLFDNDALILSSLNSSAVSLIDRSGKKRWTFRFSHFPYLGIWSMNRESPFICIEPWFGMADELERPVEFIQKKAITWVHPGDLWSCQHEIEIEK